MCVCVCVCVCIGVSLCVCVRAQDAHVCVVHVLFMHSNFFMFSILPFVKRG